MHYILEDTSDGDFIKCKVHINVPSIRLHLAKAGYRIARTAEDNYKLVQVGEAGYRLARVEEVNDGGEEKKSVEGEEVQGDQYESLAKIVQQCTVRFLLRHNGSVEPDSHERIVNVMAAGIPEKYVEHLTQVFLYTRKNEKDTKLRGKKIKSHLDRHGLNRPKLASLFLDFAFTTSLHNLAEQMEIWIMDLRCQAAYIICKNDLQLIKRFSEICGKDIVRTLLEEAREKQKLWKGHFGSDYPRLFYSESLTTIENLFTQHGNNPEHLQQTAHFVERFVTQIQSYHVKEGDWNSRMFRYFRECLQHNDPHKMQERYEGFAKEKRLKHPSEFEALDSVLGEVSLQLFSGAIARSHVEFLQKITQKKEGVDEGVREKAREYVDGRAEAKQDENPDQEMLGREAAYNIYLEDFLRELEEEQKEGIEQALAKAVAKKGNKKKKRKKKKAAHAAEQHRSVRAKENSSAVRSISPFDIERFLEYAHQVLPERLQSVENYALGIGIEPDPNFRRLKKEIEDFVAHLPFSNGGDVLTRHKICELDQEVQASLRALESWVEDKLEAQTPDDGGPDQEQILEDRMSEFIRHVFDVIAKADLAEARNNGESTCVDVTPEMVPHINRYFHNLRLKLNREIRIGNKRRFLKMNEALAFYVTRKSKTPDILFCISVHRWRLRQKPDLDRKHSQSLAHMDERFWEDLDKRDRNSFYVLHIPKLRK
ncbi:MAG: hypothetical protein ABJN40_21555 [Sneathiella sp.]